MARDPQLSDLSATVAVDAVTPLFDDGYLRIYDGSKPPTANTPVYSQMLLAELRFTSPAFANAVKGMAKANTILPEPSARTSGSATWFRALMADGKSVVMDGTIGTSNSDLVIRDGPFIASGSDVSIDSLTYRQRKSMP